MNNRQKEIFRNLLMEPNRLWLVQDLADQTECSEKTIRNDLKVIEEYIVQHSSGHLVKRPGLGVFLEIGEADQADLFHRLYSNESTAEDESDEERVAPSLSALDERKACNSAEPGFTVLREQGDYPSGYGKD